jgi:mannitol-1-phosphate 5-dehydrogenase
MLKKALHFGAGRIGRALVGNILHKSGYQILFVDVSEPLVETLCRLRQYPLQVIAPEGETTEVVDRVTAIHFDQREHIEHAVFEADLVSTSVGPLQLPAVAPLIAAGLRRRTLPLNIIPFENTYANGDLLRKLVFEHLTEEEQRRCVPRCGFPNTTITVTAFDVKRDDPTGLLAGIDRPEDREIVADRAGFVPPVPELAEIIMTDQLARYEDRKMFVAGAHAVGAWAGHRRGHEFYSKAMQEPDVREALDGAVAEINAVLQRMHGFSEAEMRRYLDPLVARFCDLRFSDPIARVGRDPKRKLAPGERIVRPARYAVEQGLKCDSLLQGIVDALHYDHPQDKEAQEIQASLREKGFERTLSEVTGIKPAEPLGRSVCSRARKRGRESNGLTSSPR